MVNLEEALGMLGIIAGFVIIVFILAKYTYMIKKAMIDKGMVVQTHKSNGRLIDVGCIIIGLGIGFLVSSVFTEMNLTEDTTDLLVWGTIGVFGGVSVIAAYFLRKKFDK